MTPDAVPQASGLTSALLLPDGNIIAVLFADPAQATAAVLTTTRPPERGRRSLNFRPADAGEWTQVDLMAIPTVILVDQSGKVVSLQARGAELGSQLQRLLGAEKAKGSSARSSHDIVEKPASSSGKGDKNEPVVGEIPTPVLAFKDKEGGQGLTRYRFTVTNGRAFPDELFEASPDLPPIGSNRRASRAFVTLYSSSGRRLKGFVAFKNGESLMGGIWFTVRDGEAPPEGVYVEILDRKLQEKFKSNVVKLMPEAN